MSSPSAETREPYALGANAMFLLMARASQIAASFLLYVILVRIFDRDQINTFGLALTFNNLFALAADGTQELLTQIAAFRDYAERFDAPIETLARGWH